MKKFYLKMDLVALLAIICCSTLNAQNSWQRFDNKSGKPAEGTKICSENPQIPLGYVDSNATIYDGNGIGGFDKDKKAGVAIKLTKSMLGRYIGGKIVALRMGWAVTRTETCNLFVKKDIQGESLTTGNGSLQFGWNQVNFDTPLVISEETEDLFFGFYTNIKAQEYAIPVQRFAIVPNSCYLWQEGDLVEGKEYWEDFYKNNGMILLQVIVEGEGDMFDNMLDIDQIRYHSAQIIGEISTALYTVTNWGTNPIDKLEINYQAGDKKWNKEITLNSSIPPAKTVSVSLPINALETGKSIASISKVNGVENKCRDVKELNILGITSEIAKKFQRRPLLEFFESENNYLVPYYYDEYFYPGYEPYKERISLVSHHLGDQFMMGEDEDSKLVLDFVDGDSAKVSLPGTMIDRTDNLSNPISHGESAYNGSIILPDFVKPIYETALSMPTFASVNIETDYNPEKLTAKIDVKGEIAEGVMPKDESLYLTVYVTEDGIVSNSQEFRDPEEEEEYGGVYTHNHLIRIQPTPMYGIKLDANSGNYQQSFEIELEKEWKPDSMKVIAFLNRGVENNSLSREVINTGEVRLENGQGIKTTEKSNEICIYNKNGCIYIEGNQINTFTVYNLTGYEVPNHNLKAGIYLVKITSSSKDIVKKIAVK